MTWHRQWQWGRLQLGFHLYKHVYPTTPDRWVVQPFVVYDRHHHKSRETSDAR